MEIENTKEMVCPYCGYICDDSWEFDENNGTRYCGNDFCGREFYYSRNIVVDYSTSKLDENNV